MATLQDTVNQFTSGTMAGMSVLPGRTQPEGTTGSLVPPAPEAPQEPPTPSAAIQLEEPTVSPTVISTDSLRSQLDAAQESLNKLKTETQTDVATQTEQPDTTVTETVTTDGQDEIDAYTKETTKLLRDRERAFDKYLTRSSSLLKSQVASIKKQFDVRRQSAEQVAANAKAASGVLGARTGRLRYAPEIQQGIITGQENALITTLSEIDALEAAAIAAAEGAAFDRDYDTFLDKIDDLDTLQKEREKTLDELTAAMEEENQRRQDEAERAKYETNIIEQIAAGTTDPIEIFTALNGQAPYDLIVEYTSTIPQKDYEFIRGDKYNAAGYFDSTTGEFVNVSGGYSRGSDGAMSYSGPLSINGQVVGDVTPSITLDDIEALNISDTAKAYVRQYKQGRMTFDQIMDDLKGDRVDRNLRNEVVGVISRMALPEAADDPMTIYMQEQSNSAITALNKAFAVLDVQLGANGELEFAGEGLFERAFDTSNTPLGRWALQKVPGTQAKDLDAALETVKALIGFDALADMRAASPTGGALGQVTEKELRFLQSVRGSIDSAQSTPALLQSLKEVYDSFNRINAEAKAGTTVKVPSSQSNSSLLGLDTEEDLGGVPSVLQGI